MIPVNKKINSMCIQGVGVSTIFEVSDVLVQKDIIDVNSSIPSNQISQDYRHLTDLKFPAIDSSKIELLLGQNVQSAFCVSELRYHSSNEPHAFYTSLGWALWGNDYLCSTDYYSRGIKVNFILAKNSSCKRILDVLHQDFEDIELPEAIKMSKDNRKAEIFEELHVVDKKDNHYTIALPWRDKSTSLPNNKKMAEKRLLGLKRKLIANEDMYEKYSNKIKEYVDCG